MAVKPIEEKDCECKGTYICHKIYLMPLLKEIGKIGNKEREREIKKKHLKEMRNETERQGLVHTRMTTFRDSKMRHVK